MLLRGLVGDFYELRIFGAVLVLVLPSFQDGRFHLIILYPGLGDLRYLFLIILKRRGSSKKETVALRTVCDL